MSDTLTPSHLDDEASAHLLEAIADPASRPNPYPLYEILRERPVWRNAGGAYVIGRYRDVANLIRDPRLSSDAANFAQGGAALSFLNTDPPEHDRLRRMTMRYFGPPGNALRVQRMTPVLKAILRSLVDKLADRSEVDVVAEISYAFPGRVMSRNSAPGPKRSRRQRTATQGIARKRRSARSTSSLASCLAWSISGAAPLARICSHAWSIPTGPMEQCGPTRLSVSRFSCCWRAMRPP
jgi:cytochrome P450